MADTDAREEFLRRFRKYGDKFDLHPVSDQTRNADGTPGHWIAKAYIFEHAGANDVVHPIFLKGKYQSKAEADVRALWGALEWLEENA